MKKIILLFIIYFALYFQSFSQKFTQFKWDSEEVTISSVKMKVQTEKPNTVIFDGYKDGKIVINSLLNSPLYGTISIKLGGYLDIKSAKVIKFENVIKSDFTTAITYMIDTGKKYVYLFLKFDDQQKLDYVLVSAGKDLDDKNGKPLSFTLEGFD